MIRLPLGVRDFLPRAAARRRALAEALLGELERWGYERIITPAFEYADVLERGLGEGGRAAAIRFVEPSTGEIVALRPDLTPQIARAAATRLMHVGGPLRLCYEGSVLRLQHGTRELIQAGVELIGAPAPDGDAEVLALAASALAAAGVKDAVFELGHAALVRRAVAGDRDLGDLVARKDRAGIARRARDLTDERRVLLEALPTLYGEPAAVLARARELPGAAPVADELAQILALAPDLKVTVDLGEARGFDYYTGARFAAYVPGAGDAILRGGRYDDLVGRYGRPAPATGFAVDVEAIASATPAVHVASGALVVGPGAAALAARLRAAGKRAAAHIGNAPADWLAYATDVGLAAVVLTDPLRIVDGAGERPSSIDTLIAFL
jgi:ATP phosphoribosyltransferase regulatory subunit